MVHVVSLLILLCVFMSISSINHLSAESVTVELEFHSNVKQTSIYRADISNCGLPQFTDVTTLDSAKGGGADGIFSGFDLDFILLDIDGDLSSTRDQIYLIESIMTLVRPGFIRNRDQSVYQPTKEHPGVLFGLKADGTIDFKVGTLSKHDASYTSISNPDNCTGWVSLGEEGLLEAIFQEVFLSEYDSLFLFIGEVGVGSGETILAILKSR